MEPIRPEIDVWVLDPIPGNVFRKADFYGTRQGVCRLMPPQTEQFMRTHEHWRKLIAPGAECLAKRVMVAFWLLR